MPRDHVDVLIIGAGLSGIGAACHLQTHSPGKTYAILEARDRMGGTWDLFKYPGIRSDSDMYTLGYSFRPWEGEQSITDGASILDYVKSTASDNRVDPHIRYDHKVVRADWSSQDAEWTIEADHAGDSVAITASFIINCTGYYSYEGGFMPEFEGRERFQGEVIHPQQWPEDLDYSGKRVVIIGSGATAVTLVPTMAQTAAHVTMLQRSPTYVISMPGRDAIADVARKRLPAKTAYSLVRWKNVFMTMFSFELSRKAPSVMKKFLRTATKRQLPEDYPVDVHFKPRYNPWDERLCLVPNGDLFRSIRKGQAEIVTDHIASFTETGIQLKSGDHLEADIIVSATGLNLLALGGAEFAVDGEDVVLSDTTSYKGMMLSDVPNLAIALGYTNASWTLKCDLTCEYVCRLLNHMDANGYASCTPRLTDPSVEKLPFIDFASGYVQRSIDQFPKQGSKAPWRLYQNYARDIVTLRRGAIEDGAMQFQARPQVRAVEPEPTAA